MPSGRLSASLLKRKRLRVGRSMASTPTFVPASGRTSSNGSPGSGVASILTVRSSSTRTKPGSPTRSEAHTRPSASTEPTTTISCSSRNSRAACGMVEWMLLPTRSAIGRTPARFCTSISPGWYFALTSYLSLRPHLLLLLYESCLRQSGLRATPPTMAPPSPRPSPPAKRKGARLLLGAATVRNRNRRARASPF